MSYAAVKTVFEQYKIRPMFPCKYCEEDTNCSCGCCHSTECNKKRMHDENESMRKFFDYDKSP